jgi:hypothetical protein
MALFRKYDDTIWHSKKQSATKGIATYKMFFQMVVNKQNAYMLNSCCVVSPDSAWIYDRAIRGKLIALEKGGKSLLYFSPGSVLCDPLSQWYIESLMPPTTNNNYNNYDGDSTNTYNNHNSICNKFKQ